VRTDKFILVTAFFLSASVSLNPVGEDQSQIKLTHPRYMK
jgi:hypothetical protein